MQKCDGIFSEWHFFSEMTTKIYRHLNTLLHTTTIRILQNDALTTIEKRLHVNDRIQKLDNFIFLLGPSHSL